MKKVDTPYVPVSGEGLIQTKLNMPPLKGPMVERENLLGRLSAGFDARLVAVSGSAGSGKTSLVSQWIARQHLRSVWYSIDETDNDGEVFFRYLLNGLRKVEPDIFPPDDEASRRTGFAGFPAASFLINGLAGLSTDLYLVLDDYHHITSREVHEIIVRLLNQPLDKFHLVITSRYAVPAALTQLKIRNQMVHITPEEMRFTMEETEEFFRLNLSINLSPRQIEDLNRHMEGWAGGLRLFTLSLKDKNTVEAMSAILNKTLEETSDYLISEVIDRQPEKVRHFLSVTALLDRFSLELYHEITGFSDGRGMIDYVERNNLFLTHLDQSDAWYRYHHLFAKALKKRVHTLPGGFEADVYRKAALWFGNNGFAEDAFRHAFLSGDMEFAADVMEDHLTVLYERNEIISFRRWLSKLPHHVFRKRALLRILDCRFRIESLQLSDVSAILVDMQGRKTEILARYTGAKRKFCDEMLRFFDAFFPCWYGPEEMEEGVLRRTMLQTFDRDRLLYGMKFLIPFHHFRRGEMAPARKALDEISQEVFLSENVLAVVMWFRLAATVERFQGRLHRVEDILKEAAYSLDRHDMAHTPVRSMADLEAAWMAYFHNDLDKAFRCALSALTYVARARFAFELVDVNHLLALIYIGQGKIDRAKGRIRRIEAAASALGAPVLNALANLFVARLSMMLGNLDLAENRLNEREAEDAQFFSFRFVYESMTKAEIVYRRGRFDDAVEILTKLRSRCTSHGMMEAVLGIDLSLSASYYRLGEKERAGKIMEDALSFAAREGYVSPFLELADAVAPVLADLPWSPLRDERVSAYLAGIVRACSVKAVERPAKAGTPNGSGPDRPASVKAPQTAGLLTKRELEILVLVAAGYKDQEIAEKVFVSLHTVKTHLKHIFEKLKAKNRVQAIRRAGELNWL